MDPAKIDNVLEWKVPTNWDLLLVFKGPVYRTEKKTETGLNWTD
jgi:hypothetical protein